MSVAESGEVKDYHLRQKDPKRRSIMAFHDLHYRVIAAGDSYNDTSMLAEADRGILFRPPQNVIDEFPQYPVVDDYHGFRQAFREASVRDIPA